MSPAMLKLAERAALRRKRAADGRREAGDGRLSWEGGSALARPPVLLPSPRQSVRQWR